MEEKLLNYFKSNKKYTFNELCRLLNAFEKSKIKEELQKLELQGFIISDNDNYQIFPNNFKIETIKIDRNNNGYFLDNNNRYTIINNKLNGCLNNDLCVVNIDTLEVVKILKRKSELITATFINNKLESKYNSTIKLKSIDYNKLVEGNVILLKIDANDENELYCSLVEIIGHVDDPNTILKAIALSKSFNINFSKDYMKELNKINNEVTCDELNNRLDLRNELIYTIDCDDTKDMDDAISVKRTLDGYEVGVHIADVSHYVHLNSAIFDEAYKRATSVYMIDTVIPMIHHYLSNGICSLNPNVDRLTISCIINLDKDGKVIDYKIVKSVINSKKKMNYSSVNEILMHNNIPEGYEEYVDNLRLANEVSFLLNKQYKNDGYLQFGNHEIKYFENSFNIVKHQAAEKIIEMYMLLANKTVAENFEYLPFPFRIHEAPLNEDIAKALTLIKEMGYEIPKYNDANSQNMILQEVLKFLYENGDYSITSLEILKNLKKARYSPNNIGHFGLGFNCYTHFTSPIRRFPDLLTHIIISNYISDYNEKELIELNSNLYQYCEQASIKEELADEAEQEALNYKMAEYMEHHINEYFNGKIIAIKSNYITVKLENNIIGLVYLKDLKGQLYFNGNECKIENKTNNITFKIGDYVRLRSIYANKLLGKINFTITEKLEKNKIKTFKKQL